jgi:hypothetical protein
MATAADIDALVTLELAGHRVTPQKFLNGVRGIFGIVEEITKSVCEDRLRVTWRVQVKAGSNLVGITPEPGFPPPVVALIADSVGNGINMLEQAPSEPPYFSPRALRYLRDLAAITGTVEDHDTRIRIWVRKDARDLTHRSVAHTAELLTAAYADHGSIEGRLQVVSERRGLQIVVYEPLWDKPVRCHLNDEQAAVALQNFGKRVEVTGLVRYRGDGTPVSIDVEEIVPFPAREDIPGYRAVHGILRDVR